jgi:hypothetical protein
MNKTNKAIPELRSLFIEARLWHDRQYGNTYHAVQLHANGLLIGTIGMTYGYEDQFKQTALAWLKAYGLVDSEANSLVSLSSPSLDLYTNTAKTLKKQLWPNWVNQAAINKIKEGRI